MKKTFFLLSLILANCSMAFSQAVATDFMATDCGGGSHNLFTELDAGKIIVLVWVEPCVGCTSDLKAGYDAAHGFASSNPGKVQYWLADDAGNTDCATLSDWASANGVPTINITTFPNTGNTIDQSNYGGEGMPHVVVLSGTNHRVVYNQRSGTDDKDAITMAINNGFVPTGINNVTTTATDLELYPNPATDKITLTYSLQYASPVTIDLFDMMGAKVKTIIPATTTGQNKTDINTGRELPNGIYLLRLNTAASSQTARFTVAGQ